MAIETRKPRRRPNQAAIVGTGNPNSGPRRRTGLRSLFASHKSTFYVSFLVCKYCEKLPLGLWDCVRRSKQCLSTKRTVANGRVQGAVFNAIGTSCAFVGCRCLNDEVTQHVCEWATAIMLLSGHDKSETPCAMSDVNSRGLAAGRRDTTRHETAQAIPESGSHNVTTPPAPAPVSIPARLCQRQRRPGVPCGIS